MVLWEVVLKHAVVAGKLRWVVERETAGVFVLTAEGRRRLRQRDHGRIDAGARGWARMVTGQV